MKKLTLILFIILFPLLGYSQITKSDEQFKSVYTFDEKVVFVKEIEPSSNDLAKNYFIVKEWAKINFDQDPFNSSMNSEDKNKKITARSRIELLLPENNKGVREKFLMKYKIVIFFSGDKCIAEISSINFFNNAKENQNTLGQKIKAENLITDLAISIDDADKETREYVRKNTIYFFNDLINSMQNALNK